jgi:hypothetical protein
VGIDVLIYFVPIAAGIIARRYVGRILTFAIMLELYQVVITAITLGFGTFRPLHLVPGIFLIAPISLGSFIPPLVFLLATILFPVRTSAG